MEFISKEHILGNSKELYKKPKINGLYFLIYKKNIVYIGSGNDVHKRIESHKQTPVKRFTKYFILPRPEKRLKLNAIEAKYIAHFKPIYNKTSNPDYHNGTKPIWFSYISQEKTVMDISKELGLDFQRVNGIVKGERVKRDEFYEKVSNYLLGE